MYGCPCIVFAVLSLIENGWNKLLSYSVSSKCKWELDSKKRNGYAFTSCEQLNALSTDQCFGSWLVFTLTFPSLARDTCRRCWWRWTRCCRSSSARCRPGRCPAPSHSGSRGSGRARNRPCAPWSLTGTGRDGSETRLSKIARKRINGYLSAEKWLSSNTNVYYSRSSERNADRWIV